MDYVDLQRRRRDRGRRRHETPPRSVARDPLFLLGTGFVIGALATPIFLEPLYAGGPNTLLISFPSMLLVAVVALICYAGWLLLRKDPEPVRPKLGSEKQLLLAIEAAGAITPIEAALETSLTVDEAEEILTRFADRGHLVVHGRDGALYYALPGRPTTPEGRTV